MIEIFQTIKPVMKDAAEDLFFFMSNLLAPQVL